jgi:hypothetical protein
MVTFLSKEKKGEYGVSKNTVSCGREACSCESGHSLQEQASSVSADSSGRFYFYLLKRCLFGFKLTGTLTGKPKNTQRFSTKTMETKSGK